LNTGSITSQFVPSIVETDVVAIEIAASLSGLRSQGGVVVSLPMGSESLDFDGGERKEVDG
jgi:hypothetical protein